jgi:UDP-glucose 4-epimerase
MSAPCAFVIGARGFVGSNTVRALLAAGWRVHAYGPPMAPDLLSDLAGRFAETHGTVEDADAMARAMADAGATVVLNFAAYAAGDVGLARSGEADADRAFDVNLTGLRRSFDAALRAGVPRVVWSSSTTLYGPAARYPGPVDETAEARPQGVYGLTKALGEQLSSFYRDRHGLQTVAVRLPLVFGPGLWYRGAAAGLAALFRAARPGVRHVLEGPAEPIDLMYAPDCADALVAIAAHPGPVPERLNINGFTTTYAAVARAVAAAVPGFEAAFEPRPAPVVYPLVRTDLSDATIGFVPRFGLDAAVRDFIAREGGRDA